MIDSAVYIISNWCNLSCPHCFKDAREASNNEVGIKDVINFLDSFPQMSSLKITGGEPLGSPIYPKTYELVSHAVAKRWDVQINTNGTFSIPQFDLSDKVAFQVSLDGLQHTHDSIRGLGTFDKAVEFIKDQKSKGSKITVMSVIMGQYTNFSDLERFMDFVTIVMNVPLELQVVAPIGRGESLSNLLDISKVTKEVLMRKSNRLISRCYIRTRTPYCPTIHEGNRVGIDEFGNIIPCPFLNQYKFGTIYDYNEQEVREQMHDTILNCSCGYPKGGN